MALPNLRLFRQPVESAPAAASAAAGPDLDQVFRLYAPQVAARGLAMLGSADEADDLVQEVFLRAFRAIGHLSDREAVRPWLLTIAVREGLPPSAWGENSEALFLTSSFVQPDAATAAARFANEEEAFIYSRFTNPTVTMFERRLAALEGTEACIATSSGMSAILLLGMGLLKAGDHVVCSQSVFGATVMLFGREFAKFGVETTFVSQTDVAGWQAAVRPNTKLLFAESPTNPLTEVCDIRALSAIARDAGALLAVDNCFCTPALQRPVEYGADLIVHSGTKYLDGQGRVIAGALCGSEAIVNGKFVPVMRSAGMSLSPFNAWVVLKGLETLSIRMQAQSERALALARWLETQAAVERVYYPCLLYTSDAADE